MKLAFYMIVAAFMLSACKPNSYSSSSEDTLLKDAEFTASCVSLYSAYAVAVGDTNIQQAEHYVSYVQKLTPLWVQSEILLLSSKTPEGLVDRLSQEQKQDAARAIIDQANASTKLRVAQWNQFFATAQPSDVQGTLNVCEQNNARMEALSQRIKDAGLEIM